MFVDVSYTKLAVVVIGFVSFPINNLFAPKVFTPVPPILTFNVPPLILLAFKFVKPAPEPLNKLEVIVPLAFIVVVSIPPRAYIIPLNEVLIARE